MSPFVPHLHQARRQTHPRSRRKILGAVLLELREQAHEALALHELAQPLNQSTQHICRTAQPVFCSPTVFLGRSFNFRAIASRVACE